MTTTDPTALKSQLRQRLVDALEALGVDRARAIGLLELHVAFDVALHAGGRAFARHEESTCEDEPEAVASFARYLLGALPTAHTGRASRTPAATTPHAMHRRHITSAF